MTHPMAEKLRAFRTGDMLGHNGAIWIGQAAAELDRLHAIVERLPRTADGVLVVPGMEVWVLRLKDETPRIAADYIDSPRPSYYDMYGPRRCYSTRAAAEAARGEEK